MRKKKKLELSRETLKQLDNLNEHEVVGAATPASATCIGCYCTFGGTTCAASCATC
jgi:hypothetical protein